MVDEFWVGAVEECKDGCESGEVLGDDVEHRLPVEGVVSILLVEDEKGCELGGPVEGGEGGCEAGANGMDGGVDAALGEAELVRSDHVADSIELRSGGETCCDASIERAHADGAGRAVLFGGCNEETGT